MATKRSLGGLVVICQGSRVGRSGLSFWYMLSWRLCIAAQPRLPGAEFSAASFGEYFLWYFFR